MVSVVGLAITWLGVAVDDLRLMVLGLALCAPLFLGICLALAAAVVLSVPLLPGFIQAALGIRGRSGRDSACGTAVRSRFELRLLMGLVVGSLLVPYAGSYYYLSRRGMREARAYNMVGFLYVPADEVFATRDLSRHDFLMQLYAPLNWLDRTLFGGGAPVRGITWGFSKPRE